MKVLKVEQQEDKKMYLEIEIDAEVFKDSMMKSYRKNVKSIAIPGFRKGKVPKAIIEKFYGEAVFYDDAINFCCPDAYDEAVKETGIDPVEMPRIDIISIKEGDPFVFSATVTVRPEVTLGEYKGVEAVKLPVVVSDEEINEEIAKMQDNAASIETIEEGTAEKGDTVTLDFDGSVDGVPFEGGKAAGFELELGSGQFIPGFEDQLIGKEIGADVDVNVTFPEDYHAAELAGKAALFKCKMHKAARKNLPAIDDEFAKDVSEFDTLEQLRQNTAENLAKSKEHEAEHKFENDVVDAVVANATVDVPDCMVDQQCDKQVQDMAYRLQSQGLTMENYLSYTGLTIENIKEQMKESAANNVKTSLVLEAVMKAEGIEATDEDVEAEYKNMAEMYKMEVEKVKEIMSANAEALKADLAISKTVKFLTDNAVMKQEA
ncbi:MAG: trigger factor [Clostridia bacterium]